MLNRTDLPPQHRRTAFTLAELLVVIAIVLIVLSLTAAAAIQVMAFQRGSVTEMSLKALSNALDRQWASVVSSALKETAAPDFQTTHPGIYAMAYAPANANGAPNQNIDKRAKVIYVKLRLKQEFPMNFSEALYPYRLPPVLDTYGPPLMTGEILARPSYGNYPTFQYPPGLYPAPKGILRNAKIYVPSAGEAATIYPASFNPSVLPYQASVDPATWPIESSACLLISLQQARNGYALTEDDLGSGMLQTDVTTGLKILVDAWQQPVYFYRWQGPIPYSVDSFDPNNQNNRDVDNSNPSGAATVFRDPLDPEGVLLDPDWNNAVNFASRSGVWWFELYCHPVHEVVAGNYAPRAYYTLPTLVSGGRNRRPGLMQMGSQTNPNPPPAGSIPTIPAYVPQFNGAPPVPPGLFPSPLLPDLMDVDPGDLPGTWEGSNDNIYSYRLRPGARGD